MRERRSRPAQTKVPALKGLACEEAEKKLHAANLNIRLLATRYDSAVQPRFIIDQTPTQQPEVVAATLLALPLAEGISLGLI
jgi:beta-lactam-binding protein with PASTA domain